MSDFHVWQDLSLHFKLCYGLGYRYLDRCGELMLKLEQEHGFVPTEASPSGAKMELPEDRIAVELDVSELRIRQENPGSGDTAIMTCARLLSSMILEHFDPALPTSAGFASKAYRLCEGEINANQATIKSDGELHMSLAQELDVQARSQELHHVFESGSYQLQFSLKPVSINTPQRQAFPLGFNPSSRKKDIIDRRNKALNSFPPPFSGYALLLDVDLVEQSPSGMDFEEHFGLMKSYQSLLLNRYAAK